MKRTIGAALMVVGIPLALASIGPLSWGLGVCVAVWMIVGGAAMTRNPEAWI